jgi:hypothetical protein
MDDTGEAMDSFQFAREISVWTLVLFTMVVSASGGIFSTSSGVHSTVTTFNFDTLPQCEAVERALAESGSFGGATYRIWGKCITPPGK